MQTLDLVLPATRPLAGPVHVGVVASGDLEVLLLPAPDSGRATIRVRTSVDGFDTIWRRVLDRAFGSTGFEADVEINDFGATPGMVSLRLAQAFELAERRA